DVGEGVSRLSDAGSNVAVFRSQKREIEEDFNRGVLSEAERDTALKELSQRLADEVPGATSVDPAPVRKRPWILSAALGVLIPLAAVAMYVTVGMPQALREGGVAALSAAGAAAAPPGQTAGPNGEAPMSDKQILAMVDTLAQKMQEKPDDPKGWVLLARSQNALGRYPQAVAAYERATKLLPNDAQLLADYADALVLAQDGRFDGKPVALIQQVLKMDPNNMKGLALAGTAELRLGNRETSLKHWEKLKTLVAKDSDDYRQVEAIMAEIRSGKPMAPQVARNDVPPAPNPAPANAPSAKAGNPAVTVSGQVTLAPEVAAKMAASDTLFVFARAKEGPRMPLAVLRIPVPKVGEFPKTFELTDAMAMAPGMNLSSFPEVVVEARISKSGNAQLQPGDLSGVSEVIKPGTRNVKVTISRVAP
ncbi:MAG: c-type cytochrome biogenesis protein CcmI, partial [Betaproteobacteria bacterium]